MLVTCHVAWHAVRRMACRMVTCNLTIAVQMVDISISRYLISRNVAGVRAARGTCGAARGACGAARGGVRSGAGDVTLRTNLLTHTNVKLDMNRTYGHMNRNIREVERVGYLMVSATPAYFCRAIQNLYR